MGSSPIQCCPSQGCTAQFLQYQNWGCFPRSFCVHPDFAEGCESLSSFQNEGKEMGLVLLAQGLLAFGMGILLLQHGTQVMLVL